MNPITLTINGETHEALAEPRQHLGDFLRETIRLTGTHLGCEHGVCGACTVLIDDRPARACIAFAVACEGSTVRTIEGFEADPVMRDLRAAFTRHHALQCGFCTPGMLIAARDLVLRVPDADERRVRVEMSGNLCRCTGFAGIVRAILEVLETRRSANASVLEGNDAEPRRSPMRAFAPGAAPVSAASAAGPALAGAAPASPGLAVPDAPAAGSNRIEVAFVMRGAPADVWRAFADVKAVAACLPGAESVEVDGDRVRARIVVRFGPMKAAFAGAATHERDEVNRTGRLRGAGQDNLSQSRARADIVYRLEPAASAPSTGVAPDATRVLITMDYSLQGPLAQFSRASLMRDFAERLVADFGATLDQRLSRAGVAHTVGAVDDATSGDGTPANPGSQPTALNGWGFLWRVLRDRVLALLGAGRGRR
jgi:carbon-monoxide dehydrogenase small subunit